MGFKVTEGTRPFSGPCPRFGRAVRRAGGECFAIRSATQPAPPTQRSPAAGRAGRPSGSLRPPDRFAGDSPVGPSSPAGRSASRLSRFRRSAKPRRRGGGGRQKSVPDFPGMASLPPLPVLRGRIEVGVLRRWLCQVEAATNAAAVNPHPTLPLGTGRGNKRWSRMDLRSPGNSGTPRQNASGRT
jgi:hypothetical protein